MKELDIQHCSALSYLWLNKISCKPKSDISYILSHYYAKIKVDYFDSLPVEKNLTLHSVIKYIQSIQYKNKTHYYNKIF